MVDRQPSSSSSQPHHQRASSDHHTSQGYRSTANGNYRRDDRARQFEPASKKRFNTQQRPITNTESEDGRNSTATFCQYNPQHVVSSSNRRDHENYDCPDRHWAPGQPRAKYHDLDI